MQGILLPYSVTGSTVDSESASLGSYPNEVVSFMPGSVMVAQDALNVLALDRNQAGQLIHYGPVVSVGRNPTLSMSSSGVRFPFGSLTA